MFSNLIKAIIENPYFLSINIIGCLGITFFLILPLSKKRKADNYLPFYLLLLVIFYENFGHYLVLDRSFNQQIHEWLFDVPFQGWNIWAYNLFYGQVSKFFFIAIILNQVQNHRLRNATHGIWIFFLGFCIIFQFGGFEPMFGLQPIIGGIGNVCVIISCCLFFLDLITSDYYLEKDPLVLWQFWFATLTLFQTSLIFLSEVSYEYLIFSNISLYKSLVYISQFLYIFLMGLIFAKIASEVFINSAKKTEQNA